MCLATVYFEHDGQKEAVMHEVAWIVPDRQGIELITLIGESRSLQANIKSIDLVKGMVVLEEAAIGSSQDTQPNPGLR